MECNLLRLTDAEREAVAWASLAAVGAGMPRDISETLRALLERLSLPTT
jgi:hypothetical protein